MEEKMTRLFHKLRPETEASPWNLKKKMPTTKVIKPQQVEAPRKTVERTKPVKVRAVTGAAGEPVTAVRKSRASSCSRCPQRDRCEGSTGAFRPCRERRTRSSSTAPRTTADCSRTKPDHRKATDCVKHAAVNQRSREATGGPSAREQRNVRTENKHASQRWDGGDASRETRRAAFNDERKLQKTSFNLQFVLPVFY